MNLSVTASVVVSLATLDYEGISDHGLVALGINFKGSGFKPPALV